MKVKIGDRIYDSNTEMIMLVLSEEDKNNIKNMEPDATKYVSAPSYATPSDIRDFMILEEPKVGDIFNMLYKQEERWYNQNKIIEVRATSVVCFHPGSSEQKPFHFSLPKKLYKRLLKNRKIITPVDFDLFSW